MHFTEEFNKTSKTRVLLAHVCIPFQGEQNFQFICIHKFIIQNGLSCSAIQTFPDYPIREIHYMCVCIYGRVKLQYLDTLQKILNFYVDFHWHCTEKLRKYILWQHCYLDIHRSNQVPLICLASTLLNVTSFWSMQSLWDFRFSWQYVQWIPHLWYCLGIFRFEH